MNDNPAFSLFTACILSFLWPCEFDKSPFNLFYPSLWRYLLLPIFNLISLFLPHPHPNNFWKVFLLASILQEDGKKVRDKWKTFHPPFTYAFHSFMRNWSPAVSWSQVRGRQILQLPFCTSQSHIAQSHRLINFNEMDNISSGVLSSFTLILEGLRPQLVYSPYSKTTGKLTDKARKAKSLEVQMWELHKICHLWS